MIHLTDDVIDTLINYRSAMPVLTSAFRDVALKRAAIQPRFRCEADGTKLSTLGAVLPGQGFAGAKIYTTINGQFKFVIILFSSADGAPLATLDAQSVTRVRTAATTALAVRSFAEAHDVCAVLGTGVQGRAHAIALAQLVGTKEIRINGLGADELADEIAFEVRHTGATVSSTSLDAAIDGADVIITATRAATPLFEGSRVKKGAFVGAIGSSLPHTREIDDLLLRRASTIIVDWKAQARAEAGDLILAGDVVDWARVYDLADALWEVAACRSRDGGVVVYKAVGIGLQDIAVAGLAYSEFMKHRVDRN